jgi:hypothetical protein
MMPLSFLGVLSSAPTKACVRCEKIRLHEKLLHPPPLNLMPAYRGELAGAARKAPCKVRLGGVWARSLRHAPAGHQ